jgi:hypothetical protein
VLSEPLTDIRLLSWLRWQHLKEDIRYWLRTIGIETDDKSFMHQMYILYVIIFGIIWLITVWGYIAEQIFVLGQHVGPEVHLVIAVTVPFVIFVAQILLAALAIMSSPVKLSFEDISYVAGSPISRAAITLVNFVQTIFPFALVSAVILTWASMLFIDKRPASLVTSFNTFVTAFPVAIMLWGIAWIIGCLRLRSPLIQKYRLGWILLIGFALLTFVLPGIILWPGSLLQAAYLGQLSSISYYLMLAATLGVVAGLTWLGGTINMIDVVDESAAFARIQKLGVMALMKPDLVLDIRRETAQKGRRSRFHLFNGSGTMALLSKSTLIYLRRPMLLFGALFWGLTVCVSALALARQNAALPAWLAAACIFVLIRPPTSLITSFRLNRQDQFLASLVPFNNLQLLTADALWPTIMMIIGGLIGAALMPPFNPMVPVLIVGGVLLLVLTQAIPYVRFPDMSNSIPYAAVAALTFGLLIVAGFSFSVLMVPLAVMAITVLGMAVQGSV